MGGFAAAGCSSLSSKNEIWINWPDERFHSDKWAEQKYDPRNSTQRDVDGDNDLSVVFKQLKQ